MSSKIRKKDPCPCGSGKRYKDCCFKTFKAKKYSNVEISPKDETPTKGLPLKGKPLVGRLGIIRSKQRLKENKDLLEKFSKELKKLDPGTDFKELLMQAWDSKKLRKMSTQEIINTLESMNVHFDEEQFKTQVKDYISAIRLAEDHYYTQEYTAEEYKEDFIWLAIVELWRRLIPEQYTVELIDYAIQDGHDYIEQQNYTDGLKEWESAWNMVKAIIPPEITSMEEADMFIPEPLTDYLSNWCQDFEEELHNGGLEDKMWVKKRIDYTREFYERFPEADDLIIENMLRAEAESYAALGDMEKADNLFEALTKKFPDSVWVYIGWGDIYVYKVPDYEKAEKVYRLGLVHCTDERDEIYERLRELEKKRHS